MAVYRAECISEDACDQHPWERAREGVQGRERSSCDAGLVTVLIVPWSMNPRCPPESSAMAQPASPVPLISHCDKASRESCDPGQGSSLKLRQPLRRLTTEVCTPSSRDRVLPCRGM